MTLGLVIFDCDGVLIDSEPVSRRLLAEEACSLGWPMTQAYAHRFTGLTWSAIRPIYEAETGRTLPDDWPLVLQDRLIARMADGVPAVAGAKAMLEAIAALGIPYRVASNSSHQEMVRKFAANAMTALVAGRVHSARDVARGKPAPDVFLAAAQAQGVAPSDCIVVEDSGPGMAAAQAAGMRIVAFTPDMLPPGLAIAPWRVVRSLDALPALFAAETMGRAA